MRYALLTAICLLLAGPALAAPSARELAGQMTLIPRGPGGGLADAPVYEAQAVPAAEFDVCLDTRLDRDDIASYLQSRSALAAARFAVWLYRFDEADDASASLPSPVLVIAPDAEGRFPLAPPGIAPGKLYGWQVVASIEDGAGQSVDLWSALMYFRTAPDAGALPELLSAESRDIALTLLQAVARQRRASDGLAASLRGLRLYGNYPSASDTYYCAPLAADAPCPCLEQRARGAMAVPQLIKLGALMKSASGPWSRVAGEAIEPGLLRALADEVYTLVNQWPEATRSDISRKLSTLAAVAEKLTRYEADAGGQTPQALLSELLLAIDDLVGVGTLDANPGYESVFLSYVAATDARLLMPEEMEEQLTAVLGADETSDWLELFRDQRAQLALLGHEVERGRLSKAQLAERVSEQALRSHWTETQDVRYLEGNSCRVAPDRVKRLTAADTEQVSRLSAEVVRCHLGRLAASIWPS